MGIFLFSFSLSLSIKRKPIDLWSHDVTLLEVTFLVQTIFMKFCILLKILFQVDLVEQDKHFLEKATEYLSGTLTNNQCENHHLITSPGNAKIGSLYCAGLQNFDFSSAPVYNVIWCQWVLGHLTKVGKVIDL